jgi:hypothetical protein
VKIWHVATGRQLLTLDVIEGQVKGMAASADGRMLATVSSDIVGTRHLDVWIAPEQ